MSCRTCIHEVWAVGIGQGIFCLCEENNGKNLGFGTRKLEDKVVPLLTTRKDFTCEHYRKERCDI